jgi:hypothetical protein
MGVEPMNTGFADQRVSHFATGASRSQQHATVLTGPTFLILAKKRDRLSLDAATSVAQPYGYTASQS